MNVVAMIPGRMGSERLPVKNLALIDGRPMISYAIEAAIGSGVFNRVVVNTDGEAIGEVEVVHRGPGSSLYKAIQVRPKVKFGNLEDVLVIVREPASSITAASGR